MMKKPASPQFPIHELLIQRWSPRAFADRPVEQDRLLSLLEAARWAASSRNEQPWSFIVATQENPTDFERLLSCLMDGNRRWAQYAPVLMLSLAKLAVGDTDQPNRFAYHDTGLAVSNLIIQATALGLYAHQMGGFHRDKARATFRIPASHDPVAGIALGYLGEASRLPDDIQERERAPRLRKPLADFVFSGGWGQSPSFLNESSD